MEPEKDDLKARDEAQDLNNPEQEKKEAAPEENEIRESGPENKPAGVDDMAKQIAELNDKYLRLYAEFDNFRRRTVREKSEVIQTASADLIVSLLPVLDDFDRAVKAFDQSNELPALKEGLVLVQQKFKGILTQKGLEEMKSIGESFDTDLHEAVANLPADKEENKNKVMDEILKGYLLNGKVIRYAKVVVAN